MKFEEEFEMLKKKSLILLNKHFEDNYYITNDLFFLLVRKNLLINEKHYSNKILADLYKHKDLIRITRGYYTSPYLYGEKLDEIIHNIFIYNKDSLTTVGHYTGQFLLNYYGLVDQVPRIINICSVHSSNKIIGHTYAISAIKKYKRNDEYIHLLNKNPKIIDLLELIVCSKVLSPIPTIETVFSIYCDREKLDEDEFAMQIIQEHLPNVKYYDVRRSLQKFLSERLNYE